eukprot:3930616-Amphidinium_carterae.1
MLCFPEFRSFVVRATAFSFNSCWYPFMCSFGLLEERVSKEQCQRRLLPRPAGTQRAAAMDEADPKPGNGSSHGHAN